MSIFSNLFSTRRKFRRDSAMLDDEQLIKQPVAKEVVPDEDQFTDILVTGGYSLRSYVVPEDKD